METDNIEKAIAAHSAWKERLINTISSGTSDFDPEVVKLPDRCEFGKWLYGDGISEDSKEGKYYSNCISLHATFHVEAGKILTLALQSNKTDAEALMSDDSVFTKTSSTLIGLLNEWKKESSLASA